MKHLLPLLALAILGLLVTACEGQATPEASPSPSPPPASSTPRPTEPVPPTPTSTPTETPVPALTSTPAPSFADLSILNFETGGFGVRAIVNLPGVMIPYRISIGGVDFECVLAETVPDRLGCIGPKLPTPDQPVDIVVIDPMSGKVVYHTSLTFLSSVYTILIPTRAGNYRSPNCPPVDPKKVSCETECRIAEGQTCIVASCWDWCGYAFSINTCPGDMEPPFTFCSPEQLADEKAKNGIP